MKETIPGAISGTTDPPGKRADAYDRPAARFDGEGHIDVRASAAGSCRRALWYAATGHEPEPPGDEALTVMETGRALEPVVLRAMQRAGWEVAPADPDRPTPVTVQLTPAVMVTGHPDATGTPPLFGGEAVIEVKTRGPSAFKRWQTLGAERSHPDAVAQAALYTYGRFGEAREAVIAVLDTGDRAWDFETVPAERVEDALERTRAWLAPLGDHYAAHGPDPEVLPERDFEAGSWRCSSCPFLATCQPQAEEETGKAEEETPEVGDGEAREAVTAYVAAREALREPEQAKRQALDTLKAWMRHKGSAKAELKGHTVSLVRSTRYAVDHKRLNALLDAETRKEIVTEQTSESVRITQSRSLPTGAPSRGRLSRGAAPPSFPPPTPEGEFHVAPTNRELPCVSRHTLVMTLLEGPDHYNGHCTCDRWSYRTDDWADLGMKWAWHYIAESEGPTDDSLVRKTVRAELEAIDNYGGDCRGCGTPVVKGRTWCRTCEEPEEECGDNCERNCCWEDTVARRVARDAAHQTDPCPDCGNCRTCVEPDSPDHEDCICPPEEVVT